MNREEAEAKWPELMSNCYGGFYTPKGWDSVVEDLMESLSIEDGLEVHQGKEKLSGLRIYVNFVNNERVDKLIHAAEHKCMNMCQDCGADGKMRSGTWLRVLCDGCNVKREEARK